TARRAQLEAAVQAHNDRLTRFAAEMGGVDAELKQLAEAEGVVDLAALVATVEQAQAAVAQAEAAALRAEAAHSAARPAPDAARRAPPAARRDRTACAAPRHRGQDARQAAPRRHQESVAGGHRPAQGRKGLRGGAWRRARRRS